ncbi:MAG: site-2 protease family protein [Methanomassiliicoccaceae archaeon]|mgnify:CR=1 FL=1|nr:site-2 protease family protein [Methanomassiliicoccaceae archaeon]
MADIYGATNITPGFGGTRFSRHEIRDILISVLVLSLAFTLVMMSGIWDEGDTALAFAGYFVLCLILVTVSFIPHELGHKFLAQKYGAWSEYRMSVSGLMFSVAISFLGFLIAAPGAVYINGRISESENGKISAAGPIVNIVIGAVAIVCCHFTTGFAFELFSMIAYLNAILAVFNMIPFPPLDGSKIVKWSPAVWVAMMAAGAAEVALVFLIF